MFAKWIENDGRFAFDETDNGGIKITAKEHAALFGPGSVRKIIGVGVGGRPELQDPPVPTLEESAFIERVWRDRQLSSTDGAVTRHRDELEEGVEPTLTAEQYLSLQAYRRQLRNWPEDGEFPLSEHRPAAPTWLTQQVT